MTVIKKYISEPAAKAGIYLLTLLTVSAAFFFARGAVVYHAATAAEPQAAAAEAASARQAAPAVPAFPRGAAGEYAPRTKAAAPAAQSALRASAFRGIRNISVPPLNQAALSAELARMAALGFELSALSPSYRGEFHATAYCAEAYPHICGGNGVTASGTVPTPGLTCAADWDLLPPETWLYIEGVGIRRVEDSGSAIVDNRLDINVDTHINALRWPGFGSHNVWVLGSAAS